MCTLFLDRDGVINVRTPGDYIKSVSEFEFIPGAVDAIALLRPYFSRIVVVTNQAGVGKGKMTIEDLESVHENMVGGILAAGGKLDGVFFCPHKPDAGCTCRKPSPGMALQAQAAFPEIDFSKSIMVGDSLSDMDFGSRLGMRTVWIEGKLEELGLMSEFKPHWHFKNLWEMACFWKNQFSLI